MFGWFKKDPVKEMEKKIAAKYTQSVQLQRNGKIAEYGEMMLEIEQLEAELAQLREAASK